MNDLKAKLQGIQAALDKLQAECATGEIYDPDKRHLLVEARRLARDGALLMLNCDPASEDWLTRWALLAPAFAGAALFALGESGAAWPPGVTCLGDDFEALRAAL